MNTLKKKHKKYAGFSLIELLVVIAIIGTITTVVLIRYSDFDSVVLLKSLAYEVALSAREAQTLGVGVRGDGGTFDAAYGVHFTPGTEYILFEDLDGNTQYDSGEEVTVYTIGNNNSISDICAGSTCGLSTLDVSFKRPDLDAVFYTDPVVSNVETAEVRLASSLGNTQFVEILSTGQIGVSVTSTISGPAPSCTLSADPVEIPDGESTTELTWTTMHADTAVLTKSKGSPIGYVPLNGSMVVTPPTSGPTSQNVTYSLLAQRPDAETAICPVTVRVCKNPECTIICTELHRQGLMPDHIYKADQLYGATVHPLTLRGYHLWARPIVSLMRKSESFTHFVNIFAEPWSRQMAYEMGYLEEGSWTGKIFMSVGEPFSFTVGASEQAVKYARSPHLLRTLVNK